MSSTASLVLEARNTLGEGVQWCQRTQSLYWTDIQCATLWRYRPKDDSTQTWPMPERLACFALCEDDDWLLLGLASGLAFFHLGRGEVVPVVDVEADLPTRLNDGACDREGRFVFATLHEPAEGEARRTIASFYRLNHDLSLQRLPLENVQISNSIAFSPDGKTMYYCDSPTHTIRCCEYGDQIGASRLFIDLGDIDGEPDGSTVDAEGALWNAQWGMRRVVRYLADGREDRVVTVPALQPTRCALGGPSLQTLFITSARDGLDEATLANDSHAGALFALTVDTPGLPEARFSGAVPNATLIPNTRTNKDLSHTP